MSADALAFKELSFNTAAEFMDALQPRRICATPGTWLFRGQADSTWKLLPAALRTEPPPRLYNKHPSIGWTRSAPGTNYLQVNAEFSTARLFVEVADARGLSLPEYTMEARRLWDQGFMANDDRDPGALLTSWPYHELLPTLALAQHYGLPTRLLDFTRHPFVAAYFAASDAARKLEEDEAKWVGRRLAVWLFHRAILWEIQQHEDHMRGCRTGPADLPLQEVVVPFAPNPNLAAQEGIFLVQRRNQLEALRPPDRTPLDEFLRKKHDELKSSTWPRLWRYELPVTEARPLLKLLAVEGFTAARMFPGFGGVWKALEDESRWVPPLPTG